MRGGVNRYMLHQSHRFPCQSLKGILSVGLRRNGEAARARSSPSRAEMSVVAITCWLVGQVTTVVSGIARVVILVVAVSSFGARTGSVVMHARVLGPVPVTAGFVSRAMLVVAITCWLVGQVTTVVSGIA